MALTAIPPIPARIRWDGANRLPTSVAWGESRVSILGLTAVRDERHAYRRDRGPRLTLIARSERGELILSWDARRRRWFLEAVEEAA